MGGVVWGGLVPHPPLIIPEIGQADIEQVSDTQRAMFLVARRIREIEPDTLVIISPHGPVFYDGIPIWAVPEMHGNFSRFGYSRVAFSTDIDLEMAHAIRTECEKTAVPTVYLDEPTIQQTGIHKELDHGVMVPLHFLKLEGVQIPLVIISMGVLSKENLYQMGRNIQIAAEKTGKKVAVMASGDLSHALTADAPAGFHPAGKKFDESVKDIFQSGNLAHLLKLDRQLIHQAAECGYNPLVILAGSLDGKNIETEVLSYEGPFGVGYLVAQSKEVYQKNAGGQDSPVPDHTGRGGSSPLAQWAKKCLETYVKENRKPEIQGSIPEDMNRKAAVFVSIKKNGLLRGCIGTVFPAHESIAAEICSNAISAGTADPRFFPVKVEELPFLSYSVDVLTNPEPVDDVKKLDPEKYGVIVRKGRKTGLLLPDLEGIDSVQDQLRIACQKAGIDPDSGYSIERFQVVRYE